MKYKYCIFGNIINVIEHSRFTIGVVIGVILMLGLIKIIPNQAFIFILPPIGGFVAGIASSNGSITTTNANSKHQKLNAGEAAGIIFGIIICFIGTLLFEWTDLTDMAYLLLSPYGENSQLFSLLFIAFILILSHFYWKTILIFSLITVCLFVHPHYPLFNIIYDATFTILLSNIYVMGVICGVLGYSGNKLFKMFLDCLQNLYRIIADANFAKRMQHILSDKYIKSSISIIFVVVIIVSIAAFAPYLTEQKEKNGVLPLKVTNVEINTPEIDYYSISPLKKYATEIALENHPNVDRGFIIDVIGKSTSLTTANLDITISIYNPNNKTIQLDKIDYTLYEISPLCRYIKSYVSTEKSITLPPHTTTPVFLNSKLGVLQSGILRVDAIMFYYAGISNYRTWDSEKYPIKLEVKGILYSENSTDSFEYDINTSVAETLQFNFVSLLHQRIQPQTR